MGISIIERVDSHNGLDNKIQDIFKTK
ncbi:uncharacterized protein G2W53_040788 [Senna tora]|uniref:Uncharacterized protein n=1 Tax=Senna tora TaxID=362788 RepID=A0A834SIV1_9FABA|nr:uncharacterized protein G2W53_040788 [Senna tora]